MNNYKHTYRKWKISGRLSKEMEVSSKNWEIWRSTSGNFRTEKHKTEIKSSKMGSAAYWRKNWKWSSGLVVRRKWSLSIVSNSLRPHGQRSPGSSVHGTFQAKILEWVAISFSRGSSRSRNWTWVSHMQADPLPSEQPRNP